jgi:hypothetical protein
LKTKNKNNNFMWTLPNSIFFKFALIPVYFEIVNFLMLRYFWTIPDRKSSMMSSSLSNTIAI